MTEQQNEIESLRQVVRQMHELLDTVCLDVRKFADDTLLVGRIEGIPVFGHLDATTHTVQCAAEAAVRNWLWRRGGAMAAAQALLKGPPPG